MIVDLLNFKSVIERLVWDDHEVFLYILIASKEVYCQVSYVRQRYQLKFRDEHGEIIETKYFNGMRDLLDCVYRIRDKGEYIQMEVA